MTGAAGSVVRTLAWISTVVGLVLVLVGFGLRETGIMGELLLLLGGYAVVQGVLILAEAWWRDRGGSS